MCFKMEQTLESMQCLSKHITLHYVQYPKDLHNSAPGIAIDGDRDDIGSPLIPSSIVRVMQNDWNRVKRLDYKLNN